MRQTRRELAVDGASLKPGGAAEVSLARDMIAVHGTEAATVARNNARVEALAGRFKKPVVTTIESAPAFWPAEDYHQRYFEKNGLPSCHVRMAEEL